MNRTPKQIERQGHRDGGKYAKVNTCQSCGKSAGVDYLSHKDTDNTIGDELICLCKRCHRATAGMTGPEAVEWVKANLLGWRASNRY